ncbi:MAG: ROK family protein [Clostridia bacterium]|nr:ROK family protein [Clostridia bacterium]
MLKKKYCIGVDLGGTNIAVGLVDLDSRKIVRQASVKTNAPRSCESISADIVKVSEGLCALEKIKLSDVLWVGAITPGIVKDGVVKSAVNLGWKNVDFRKILASATRRPTYIANDANGAAYAEALWGAGEGASSLVAITIGTGVGGGIVFDGVMWEGINGFAAEMGHMTIEANGRACGCGKRGCLEAYCSATALIKETKRIMTLYPESEMWSLCGGNLDRVSGKTAFLAKASGDRAAALVLDSFIDYLAIGVSSVINILQPEVVCIGGGISREGETLLEPLRERVEHTSFYSEDCKTKLVAATFKNDAGIFGAALLGLQEDSNKMKTTEQKVAENFDICGRFASATPYGSGHINDTRLIVTNDGTTEHSYILQRINTNVFKDPVGLMNNFASVTAYLAEAIKAQGGDPDRETLNVIKAKDGKNYYIDEDGSFWRMLIFVTDSLSYDKVERPEQFYDSAVAFGNFQYMLRDYPADSLVETIPNFHNTPDRLRQFREALEKDVCGRAAAVKAEIDFVTERREFAETLEKAHKEGRLPLRVTHNDTKLNNILFDASTGKALCIVDLDTIMPGYSVNDFGDSIRFGATTALEDEADLSKVNFDISLFELYVKGFIEGAKGGLTEGELDLLPIGAMMMTFECGTRFLTDYLSGDTYFKTSRPAHNLDRARNQFKLVSDMEARLPEMRAIVKKYAK